MKNYLLLIPALLIITALTAQENTTATEKTVYITSRGLAIEGSLLSVSSKQKLVIIIAGSGPTDRNGNSIAGVNSDAYKLLAEALAKNNIASFRYDKRAIAKSAMKNFDEKNLLFDDYVNDAVTIYNYLKDTLGFKNIYFAGHSEGSLIGMIASEKTKPKGYISVAGAGRPIDKVIIEQVTQQSPAVAAQTDSLFGVLKTQGKIDVVPPYLLSVFRPSIQPYMISWMKYDPAVEISKVKSPVLILQGTCDVQVKITDAEYLHAGNKKATFIIIEGMTHVLKDATAGCIDKDNKTYHDPSLPLNTKFAEGIINFIKMH
jgi:esterase/lipase